MVYCSAWRGGVPGDHCDKRLESPRHIFIFFSVFYLFFIHPSIYFYLFIFKLLNYMPGVIFMMSTRYKRLLDTVQISEQKGHILTTYQSCTGRQGIFNIGES